MSSAPSGRQRPRGGVLTLISALMISSAVIRLGFEAGPALARGPEPSAAPTTGQSAPVAPDMQALLAELLQREEAVKRREDKLRDRERAMQIADEALSSQLSALREAEDSLRATLAVADKAAENDLARLTDVYQNMKPKDAAALFETMDPVFAAGFLSRMPPDAAAGVMAGISPEAAYTISVVMAGRNANAPTE
ncbi:MAG: MotE family protein [Ruegeria sp.]